MAAMSRTGGTEELASILDEGVMWQGLLPELVCNGRGEVLNILGRAPFPRVTRVEAEEVGDRVVVIASGADFPLRPDWHRARIPRAAFARSFSPSATARS